MTEPFEFVGYRPLDDGKFSLLVTSPIPDGDGAVERYTFTVDKEVLADRDTLVAAVTPALEAAIEARHPSERRAAERLLRSLVAPAIGEEPPIVGPAVITHRDDGLPRDRDGKVIGRESDPDNFDLTVAVEQYAMLRPRVAAGEAELVFKCPEPGPDLDATYTLAVPVADLAAVIDAKTLEAFAAPLLREQWPDLAAGARFWFIGAATRKREALQATLDGLRRSTFTV